MERLPVSARGALRLGEGPYAFHRVRLAAGASHTVRGSASHTILCKAASRAVLSLGDDEWMLHSGDSAQVENRSTRLTARNGALTALIAGSDAGRGGSPSLTVTRAGEHRRVSKPWGHELWLNGEHPTYCLKELFIRAGNRTSLQYHEQKEETILLLSGRLRLVFRASGGRMRPGVRPGRLGQALLSPPSAIHVPPGTLHRLEAVTDVLLYEASTPHLDDVIRVQDDSARPDGRVASEHGG